MDNKEKREPTKNRKGSNNQTSLKKRNIGTHINIIDKIQILSTKK